MAEEMTEEKEMNASKKRLLEAITQAFEQDINAAVIMLETDAGRLLTGYGAFEKQLHMIEIYKYSALRSNFNQVEDQSEEEDDEETQ